MPVRPRHFITSASRTVNQLRTSDISPREYRELMLANARKDGEVLSLLRTAARVSGRD